MSCAHDAPSQSGAVCCRSEPPSSYVVLSPRYDLRFEFEAARWEFASSHGRSEIGNFDMLQGTRPVSYSILLGRRFQPKRRAQLAMVAGLGVLRHSWIDSGPQDFRFNGVVTKEFSWDDHGTTNDPHLTFGLEAVVSVSARFAVIPRWRVQLSSASAEGSSGGYYLPTTTLRNVAGTRAGGGSEPALSARWCSRECAADRPISIALRAAKVDPDFLRLITPVPGRAGGRKLMGRVGGRHHGEQLRWRPSPVSVPDVTVQRLSKVASGF